VASALLISVVLIADFSQDIRHAARGLARTPVWSAGLILTIALGVGGLVAVDGFVRGLTQIEALPEVAAGMARIAQLLRVAAVAVFVIACANVASYLLSRATARARETALRVAIGAGRGQLIRHALADSVVITTAGALLGGLFASWMAHLVPAFLFVEDADQMVFAAAPLATALIAVACAAITIACGLLPLIETRHDRPGAIMQRENAGPSRLSIRLRTGLVVGQMTACTLLMVSAGLLLAGFQSALQTAAGRRLASPVVASVDALQMSSESQQATAALGYFAASARAARDVAGASAIAWAAIIPGDRPVLRSFAFEPPRLTHRVIELESVPFTPQAVGDIVLPPLAGRLFGPLDASACGGVVLSRAAALRLGTDRVVGRSIELPTGEWAQVIGVVQPADAPSAARVYHYDTDHESGRAARTVGQYRVPESGSGEPVVLDVNIVSPNYFEFMGLPVVAGRAFAEAQTACRIAVVNEEAAALYFDGDPIGGAIIDGEGRRTSIVGVVASARLRVAQRAIAPAVYFPLEQDVQPRMSMIMETGGVDRQTLRRLHRRIAAIPGGRENRIIVKTLDDHLSRTAFAAERIATVLVGALAGIALVLGVIGLYGVMSDAAQRRRREFALRVALGARSGHVVGQVIAEGMRLVAAGCAAGIAGALLVGRWLATIAPPGDGVSPLVWLTAPLTLALGVLVASVLPARRAAASDPLTLMKTE
jgi:hypothetical protein